MADKAYITPKVLKWARESARISVESAANKLKISPSKLAEWESGKQQPTITQAKNLASFYKRPLALLFLPRIPDDFQPLQDFRTATDSELSTATIFIIREIQQKQAWISQYYQEDNQRKMPFVGSFSIKSEPQVVAQSILETLQIDPANYKGDNPMREWIEKAETNGIFISRTSFIHSHLKLNSEEFQGFTIADPYAPFVFINSDDWAAPQLFTLVHELVHIWIAESGISNEVGQKANRHDKFHPVEKFCNEVAANALMPKVIMNDFKRVSFNSDAEIYRAAKKLGVSTFALLVRALNLNLISHDRYQNLKNNADIQFRFFVDKEEEKRVKNKKERKRGPNYYLLSVNKNSRLFTQIVLDGFKGGRIEPTQASGLLNVKINNFPKLESILYK